MHTMTMAAKSLPSLLRRAATIVPPPRSHVAHLSCLPRPISSISHHPLVSDHVRHINQVDHRHNSRSIRHIELFLRSNNSFYNYYQTRSITVTVTHASTTENEESKENNATVSNASSSSSNPPSYTTNHETTNGITITASCVSRIKQLASTRPNPDSIYLRLFVDAGGCSGFQYKFLLLSSDDAGNNNSKVHTNDGNIDNEEEEEEDGTIDPDEDIIFTKDGVRVVIDATSLELLRGSTIDYVSEMIKSSFAVVNNPQSESACGCGSSFAAKNFGMNPALD